MEKMENNEIWQLVLSDAQLNTSRASFNTWFQHTNIHSNQNGTVLISVPNSFAKEWLENKFYKFILKSLRVTIPEIKEIKFIISPLKELYHIGVKKIQKEEKYTETNTQIDFYEIDKSTNLNKKYTFDDFIIGSSNELAHAAATAITKNVGTIYNPLFIYGGVGLGKTHLIQAIGNEVVKLQKDKKVLYVSCEKFTSELVSAIRKKEMELFKKEYRKNDILIIDDIQFLAGKEKTQEEFFHTFNTLYEKNKQIIISSDRPPHAIKTLEDRLKSRFEGGMIIDIGYPDYETRLAILKNKLIKKEVSIPEDILEYIANTFQKNVRELEGALNKVIIQSKIGNGILLLDKIKKEMHQAPVFKRVINPKEILSAVAQFYGINKQELIIKTRKQEIVKPRQVVMYLLREELKLSYPSIGSKIGGRDHTTVMHACEKVNNYLKEDPVFIEEIEMIKKTVYDGKI